MEAKDTVISDDKMNVLLQGKELARGQKGYVQVTTIIKESQAEISFKAGYDKAMNKRLSSRQLYLMARKAGIKEVVDFMKSHNAQAKAIGYYAIDYNGLQRKLKEWGIEC
jgi:hypothetical protein